jgi:acetylornithine deacetylase/succinyl-diaminopimelate desuccinylase-like protein
VTDVRFPVVQGYIDAHSEEFAGELQTLIRLPSVSTSGEGIRECAEYLVSKLQRIGLESQLLETTGNPLVLGSLASRPGAPTLLITTHYDVQPAGPADDWDHPPYEAHRTGDTIWGRGASDAKGPVTAVISAVESVIGSGIPLDLNLKVLLDGEEEIGSPSMPEALERYGHLLHADAVVTFDGNSMADGRPIINFGGGGLLYLQLETRTARSDIHPNRGALVPNAAWRLIWALASLKSADEEITIEGFSDNLSPVSDADRALLKSHVWNDEVEREPLGAFSFLPGRGGERGPEALHLMPIVGVSGIQSGYVGEGVGAVLPAYARAMLYIGLRDKQTPNEIEEKIRNHFDRQGFGDVSITVLGSTEPSFHPSDSALASLVVDTVRDALEVAPVVYPRGHWYGRQGSWIGARIGAVAAQISIVAPAQPNDHGPNEFIPLDYLFRSIRYVSRVIVGSEQLPMNH